MRTYFECVPCFLRQALEAARIVSDDATLHERMLRETLRMAAEMPFDRSPPEMGQRIHRYLREATGNPDPYRRIKEQSNAMALALYPELQRRVRESSDPLATAAALAIAGNIIDYGCRSELSRPQVDEAIAEALRTPLDSESVARLRSRAEAAERILYLADNAGEIVFDRLLIEQLPRERIAVAVRGTPVINDATLSDAEAAGLTALVPVIDNGSDAPGTLLDACSGEFRARFDASDLVIAKGQGNYETLGGAHAHTVFLFMAKCAVAARDAGCRVGERVVLHDRPRAHSSPSGR
ncbi:MAG: DUF89 family protein [Candidatus Eisenbacteria bacterium]|nr:DUF89 family protein [Candidatus Eisenbacteria bacterium]